MGTRLAITPKDGNVMLKYIETFDNINNVAALVSTHGWAFTSANNYISIKPRIGRMGTSALMAYYNVLRLPTISPTTRIVLGMAVRHPIGDMGAGNNNNGNAFIDLVFGYGVSGDSIQIPHFTIRLFCERRQHGYHVDVNDEDYGRMKVSMWTGSTSSGYPPIVVELPYIVIPYGATDYNFLEFYVDCADIPNGRVKIALNGNVVIDMDMIPTTNYNAYNSDPFDVRAKMTGVTVSPQCSRDYIPAGSLVYESKGWLFDTIYVCDGSGGYQDDFLGPVMSKSFYPMANGDKNNWTPYVNSEVYEDNRHFDRINYPIDTTDETEFIEGDADLLEELYFFSSELIPIYSDILAVNHRTVFRNLAMPNHPTPDSLAPITKVVGNDKIIVNAQTKRLTGYDYKLLDIYYGLVPGLAIPWTKYLLAESQFGFLQKNAINPQSIESAVGITDECSEE